MTAKQKRTKTPHYEVFKHPETGKWHWVLFTAAARPIAGAAQPYQTKTSATAAVEKLRQIAATAEIEIVSYLKESHDDRKSDAEVHDQHEPDELPREDDDGLPELDDEPTTDVEIDQTD